jgi:hypothetical protein
LDIDLAGLGAEGVPSPGSGKLEEIAGPTPAANTRDWSKRMRVRQAARELMELKEQEKGFGMIDFVVTVRRKRVWDEA